MAYWTKIQQHFETAAYTILYLSLFLLVDYSNYCILYTNVLCIGINNNAYVLQGDTQGSTIPSNFIHSWCDISSHSQKKIAVFAPGRNRYRTAESTIAVRANFTTMIDGVLMANKKLRFEESLICFCYVL